MKKKEPISHIILKKNYVKNCQEQDFYFKVYVS